MICWFFVIAIVVSAIPVTLGGGYEITSAKLVGQASTDTFGSAVATLSDGSVVIAGHTAGSIGGQTNAGGNDYVMQKYDSSLNLLWTRMFGGTNTENLYNMRVDSSDNIYLVGSTRSATLDGKTSFGGITDGVVVKYNSTGTKLWSARIGGSGNEVIMSVCVDANYVYVVGPTSSTSFYGLTLPASTSGSFWMKLNPSTGAIITTIWLNNDASSTNQPSACTIGSDGNIVVVGSVSSGAYFYGLPSPGSSDATIQKVSTTGAIVWNQRTGQDSSDGMLGVAIDSSNNIYTVGYSDTGTTSYYGKTYQGSTDIVIQKLSSTGTIIWSQLLGSIGYDSANSVTLEDSMHDVLYLTGYASNTFYGVSASSGGNTFLAMLSMSNGSILYTNVFASTASDGGKSIVLKDTENVYIVGYSEGNYSSSMATVSGLTDMYLLNIVNGSAVTSPTATPTMVPTLNTPNEIPTIAPTTQFPSAVFVTDTRQAGTLTAGEIAGIVVGSFVGGSILLGFFCIVVAAERRAAVSNASSTAASPAASPATPMIEIVVALEGSLPKDNHDDDVELATGAAAIIIDHAETTFQ